MKDTLLKVYMLYFEEIIIKQLEENIKKVNYRIKLWSLIF